MPDNQLTPEFMKAAREAAEALALAVGMPLCLCVYRDMWHPARCDDAVISDVIPELQPSYLRLLPKPSVVSPRAFCLPTPSGTHLIGIPLETTSRSVVFGVGETVSGLDTLLDAVSRQSSLIRGFREERDRDSSRLDCFANQILRDFEERNWLINLTDHLQLCEVNRNISDVVNGLLPHLKAIIGAYAVAFVPESLVSPGHSRAQKTICFNRRSTPDDFPLHEIVQRYRGKAIDHPVVRNWNNSSHDPERIPGVDSLMMAVVCRNDSVTGWLLALNREPGFSISAPLIRDPDDSEHLDNEFGTVEAGLLRSAATVLATHDHNLKMFHANQILTVSVVRSLANAVDARDTYTHGHSDRVARMARHLARRSGAGPQICEQILMTGLLHDIGKIGVPDSVLLKPSDLNEEEFALIRQHPVIGHRILRHINELHYTLDGVLYHHESWNGRGYPEGLQGTVIPLFGRILAVVDAYDAMTSQRPYRDGMPFEKAEGILRKGAGSQWDPALVETFLQYHEEFRSICRESPNHFQSLDQVDLRALSDNMDSNEADAVFSSVMPQCVC